MLVLNKYKKNIEYIIQIIYLQVLIYKIERGQKTKPNQDKKKRKSHDTLSPYSNSGDHQFIPLKFRRLMNTSPKDRIWGYGGGPPTNQTQVRTEFGQLAANFRQK